MERMTEWNDEQTRHAYYPRCFEEPCYGGGCKIKDCTFETAVCDRLAAYEDTGIEPEAVETVKLALCAKHMVDLETLNNTPISRLVEIAEADKEGRVIVLPCEVGHAVYWVHNSIITDCRINRIQVNRKGVFLCLKSKKSHGAFRVDTCLGKTVFLTREKAEKALAEMEGKKDG